ncbi:hypothetical protein JTB14_021025 [Gonioctena quinquepunctata]|nr:hypothetical protein JTB14_021025 [Gonioctena quinquepunctata]
MPCDTSDHGFQILNDDETDVNTLDHQLVKHLPPRDCFEVDGAQPECDHLQLLTVSESLTWLPKTVEDRKTAYIDGDV